MVGCSACQQIGGMPLSYVNPSYREPSAFSGSYRVISEPGLARPSLNHTGGKRRHLRNTRRIKSLRKTRKRGGFYPSVMGGMLTSGPKLIPAAAITGYRMCKNYKKSRKSRQ
jgi:hypothetical protein